jgi:hypothetical protein
MLGVNARIGPAHTAIVKLISDVMAKDPKASQARGLYGLAEKEAPLSCLICAVHCHA